VEADASGRSPAPPASPMAAWLAAADRLQPARVTAQRLLTGDHLLAAGLPPGPEFRTILQRAFEAQARGEFDDEAGALEWLRGQ
jgi:tRNA nucleotidyltransferase (CCA-adding enzyme)